MGLFNSRIFELWKQKKLRTSDRSDKVQSKLSVRNAINQYCENYLHEAGDLLTFEVINEKELALAAVCIQEEPLISKYNIIQVSPSTFEARLRVAEL